MQCAAAGSNGCDAEPTSILEQKGQGVGQAGAYRSAAAGRGLRSACCSCLTATHRTFCMRHHAAVLLCSLSVSYVMCRCHVCQVCVMCVFQVGDV